ncbi:small-conductance mechanosensitive channel [Pseudorhizobium tarimense]|uniref:Small-conductance mechanosensitive channel n=1 Tax=Pseudorhizobium tarimense TaxID=1079109 RepID=A0ABV2HDQ5_9HYPH|nr:mechanosensitive ion channel family protein [Pseudorhizobium tarimense]MCJ8520995.1 mechanosensitive ion channel [Pseudorhizobium tarimense]MCJ8521024.1 mechanosensitive ion channel [Pseudorhizobium tarimense]
MPIDAAVPDQALANRLSAILTATGWYETVQVNVEQGVVSIDGVSDTAEHRSWATEVAEKMQGSIAVVNRLELSADFATTFDRAAIEIERLSRRVGQTLPLVVLAIAILAATWGAAAMVAAAARRLLERRIPSPLLRSVVVRAISIPVLLLGIYFVLQVAGLTRLAVTVLGGTGLAGIIVGFAFRDIAENFLASLLLSVRNPFSMGDLIEVAGETGIVQNLNTRSTVLLTLDGNHVQIPNATVFKSTIRNYSSTPTRRAQYTVGIGYDSSVAQAQSLISEILKQHPAVLDQPEPLVLVDELGAAAVNLRVSYWFNSRTYSPAKTNSALLRLTKNALLDAGIELPDPAREVVFPKGVPVVHMAEAPQPPQIQNLPDESAAVNETSDATAGEGELINETDQVRGHSQGEVLEASENLLKS